MTHQFTKQKILSRILGEDGRMLLQIEEKIMSHFFTWNEKPILGPTPVKHSLGEGERVTAVEISNVLQKYSKKSAPGPNQVPYRVWKGIHGLNQGIILELVNDMLELVFHLPVLKVWMSVILPNQTSKNTPIMPALG